MTRHRILNPKTGKMVFKTGTLGKNITKKDKNTTKKPKPKAKKSKVQQPKKKNPKKCGLVAGKCYGRPGATKTIAYIKNAGKTKGSAPRPSARAMLNCGNTADQYYAGKWHYMSFDCAGRPTYKAF